MLTLGEISVFLFGILLIAIPVITIMLWKKKEEQLRLTKKLNFVLNCGITYTIIFNDLEFLNKVVAIFTNILALPENNQNIYFDIKNNEVHNNIHDNKFNDHSSANTISGR